ncbi:MAG: Fic family protein [Candidatus Woesearchaeota archaeon]
MVFVRKKLISGRIYHYLVKSTRIGPGKWKKFERYIGLAMPSKLDLHKFDLEFDSIKEFLLSNKKKFEGIRQANLLLLKKGTKDQLKAFESEKVIRFTYDSNRIEGSSLTYKDTKMLFEHGLSPQKPVADIKESQNHREAYFFMKQDLGKPVSAQLLLDLHRKLKSGLTEDAGKFRDAQVHVGDLVPLRADMIGLEIGNLIAWYRKNRKMHPFELACTFHAIFERIHPFFDGNGRVGRLVMNHILMSRGYPLVIIRNRNRRRYYSALRKADLGDYLPLIKYVFSEIES